MPVCAAGAILTLLSVLSLSVHVLSFMLSLHLPIVCVVFPSLHVLCWSFFLSVADFNC